jgi:AraC-like DNA-binding protein
LDENDMPALAIPTALRDRIASLELVESDAALDGPAILPSSAIVLGVQWRGRLRGPEGLLDVAGVTGLQGRSRRYVPVERTSSLLMRFTPTGAAVLGVPLGELRERSVGLDQLLAPARVRTLVQEVADAESVARAGLPLLRLIASLPWTPDPLVEAALQRIDRIDAPALPELAAALGCSLRQLERRFLARVGTSAKAWRGLRTFERALAALARSHEQGGSTQLTTLAHALGYYDQPHFIREFKRRAGLAPRAWLAQHDEL